MYRKILIMLAVALFSTAAHAQRTIHIAFAPNAELSDIAPVLEGITRLMLEGEPGVAVGDVVAFYDGLNVRELGRITIEQTSSERAALRKYGPVVKGVVARLIELRRSVPEEERSPAINLNRLVRLLDGVIRSGDGRVHAIVLVGALHHQDPRDGAWQFGPGEYFTDATLLVPSTQSPFGTADRKGALENASVYFIFIDEQGDGRGTTLVSGMWARFFAELSATLVYCNGDAAVGLRQLRDRVTDPIRHEPIDRMSDEIKKIRIGQVVEFPVVEPSMLPEPAAQLEAARDALPAARDNRFMVAAVWSSETNRADVDLWVRVEPHGPELNFSNRSIPGGVYFRDVRNGRVSTGSGWRGTWEAVELNVGASGAAEVWLNLYRNDGKLVSGFVRFERDGKRTDMPFMFEGLGDQAKGKGQRATNNSWKQMLVPQSLVE